MALPLKVGVEWSGDLIPRSVSRDGRCRFPRARPRHRSGSLLGEEVDVRAAVLTRVRRIEMQELPKPRPRPDEVLIRVRAAGVCGSDVHGFLGTHPYRKPPAVMGHEVSGDVEEVGSEVRSFRAGDRVIVVPQRSCGSCLYCRTGSPHLCTAKVMMGTSAWPGSFGEYVVAPEGTVIGIPDNLSYEEGVMCEPLAVGVHCARRARIGIGDSVLVLGSGTIGLCCIAAARAAGATRIVATDAHDFNLELARKVGAGALFNVRGEGDLSRVVAEHVRPEGVDVAVVAAGLSPVVDQALANVRKLGRVALVALFDGAVSIAEPFHIIGKELEVVGVITYVHEDFHTAIDLIGSGAANVKGMVTHVLPIERAHRAMEIVHEKTENNAKVILTF